MSNERLDTVLVQQGLAADTQEALRMVLAHEVRVDDVYATSAAQLVAPTATIEVKRQAQFVSRGGHKLQAALDTFSIDVTGKRCIDIGCSTGGFSDCLLQAGAASVACVDVGYGDLAWKVRNDPRTTVFERTNIRTAQPAELGAPFDIAVADLSFIGLASLAEVFAQLVAPGGLLVALVKPQFESEAGEAQGGFVADPAVRERTVREVTTALEEAGFMVEGVTESPVPGKKAGNIEFLVCAQRI